jgi:hypothetical protein
MRADINSMAVTGDLTTVAKAMVVRRSFTRRRKVSGYRE